MLRPVERIKSRVWTSADYEKLKQLGLFDRDRVSVETKYDGWGVQLLLPAISSRERIQLYGRETLPSQELSVGNKGLAMWLSRFEYKRVSVDVVVMGELLARTPTGYAPAAHVPSRLKRFRDTKHDDDSLAFIAYAVGMWGREKVSDWSTATHHLHLGVELGLTTPEVWLELSKDPRPARLKEAAQKHKIEGFMIKSQRHGWFKFKTQKTADLVIMGFKPGNGKYRGIIGSIHVGAWDGGNLVEVASISGMDDETRNLISRSPQDFVGSTVEVEYQEMGKKRLRHPRFLRLRPDKPARECLLATL